MMKNIKYESIDAGKAGKGQINLQSGEFEFSHSDTISDSSILPVSISHVYSTAVAVDPQSSDVYGKGFKLNVHQRLEKVVKAPEDRKEDEDENATYDNRYKLIDAAGKEFEFVELYYYRDKDDKRVYHKIVGETKEDLTRDDIEIDFDGNLTYVEGTTKHEIFTELRTDSGLVLKMDLKGFIDDQKIETKPEEMLKVEEEVKNLERSIKELTYSLREYTKYDPVNGEDSDYVKLMAAQKALEKESLAIEKESLDFFFGLKKCTINKLEDCPGRYNCTKSGTAGSKCYQNTLYRLTKAYNDLIEKDLYNKVGGLIVKNSNTNYTADQVASGYTTGLDSYQFEFNADGSRYTYRNAQARAAENLAMKVAYDSAYAKEHYGSTENYAFDATGEALKDNDQNPKTVSPVIIKARRANRVIQFLQENFNKSCDEVLDKQRNTSTESEKMNLEHQMDLMNRKSVLHKDQQSFQTSKNDYETAEEAALKVHYEFLKKCAETDRDAAKIMLEYKQHILEQYQEKVPVNYIMDENNLMYGFNERGAMISIWDSYENVVSLVYDDKRLTKIKDAQEREMTFEYLKGRLNAIVDFLDRRTEFGYTPNGYLDMITYPNGDVSTFGYDTSKNQSDPQNLYSLLSTAVSPSGIGVKIEYDCKDRPVKITATPSEQSIPHVEKTDGEESEDEALKPEELIEILYNPSLIGVDLPDDHKAGATDVIDVKTGRKTVHIFNKGGELITEYVRLNTKLKSIKTHDVGRRKCYFTMQQTEFGKNLITSGPQCDSSIDITPDGDVIIDREVPAASRFATWEIPGASLPEHATDLVLSAFVTADSYETKDRRKTEYCDHTKDYEPEAPGAQIPRFELKAEVYYGDIPKEFIASFDYNVKTKQFAAIPITLEEGANGKPILPDRVMITADYRYNKELCYFQKPSLANGEWSYIGMDDENRKEFECSNRKISDRTVDGKVPTDEEGESKFITYGETDFEYDRKGNLVKEISRIYKNGDLKTYLTRYEYNKQSRLIRTISHDGMVSESVYDKKGNKTKSFTYHKRNPATRFVQEREKDDNGQTVAEFDDRGENKTELKYLDGTNILSGKVSPDGQETAYGTDPHTGDLLAISSSVRGEPNGTEYEYTKGFLTGLYSGGTAYNYEYEGWGRKAAIKIAGADHALFEYKTMENGDEVVTTTYANGEKYETVTDKFGKLLTVTKINGTVRTPYLAYVYDKKTDELKRMVDYVAETVTEYTYNEDGSVNRERTGDVSKVVDYNIDGEAEKEKFTLTDMGEQIYSRSYNDDGILSRITLPNGQSEKVEYDKLGRLTGIFHPVHLQEITYYQNGDNATNLVTSVRNGGDRTNYTYDKNSNIKEIFENGRLASRYQYDGLNRLVREDNVGLDESYTFDYDTNGNICFKNTYHFTLNELTLKQESPYDYHTEGNRDRMTSFRGEVCEYDLLGNPTIYRNKNLEWSNLRDLTRYEGTEFGYDAFGLRQRKSHNGTDTKFYWSGEKLLAEKRTTAYSDVEFDDFYKVGEEKYPCAYLYNDPCENQCKPGCDGQCEEPPCGEPCEKHSKFLYATIVEMSYLHGVDGLTGFTVSKNGGTDINTYYYRRNIQGDITHILDADGAVKAEYIYDAWGNHQINEDADGIGSLNPFRYRGYYFDVEIGLYYLRTRYYDPETGRFINADDTSIFDETQTQINGLNLYIYCADNPVMNFDPTGQNWFKRFLDSTLGKVVVTVLIVAAVVAVTIATAGVAGALITALGTTFIGGAAGAVGGAIAGAIIGATIGAGFSMISQGLMYGYNEINWGTVGKDMLVGALTGAVMGGAAGSIYKAVGYTAKFANASSGFTVGSVLNNELGNRGVVDKKITSAVGIVLAIGGFVSGASSAIHFLSTSTTVTAFQGLKAFIWDIFGTGILEFMDRVMH